MKNLIRQRQHYIPKMLLQHHANRQDRIYWFRRPENVIHCQNYAKSLFLETNLYDANNSREIEYWLMDIESKAGPVVNKLIMSAREDNNVCLTANEKEAWDRFFCVQCLRCPDSLSPRQLDEILDEDKFVEEFKVSISDVTSIPKVESSFRETFREIRNNKKDINKLFFSIMPDFLKPEEFGLNFFNILTQKGLAIVRSLEVPFALGDVPILKTPPRGLGVKFNLSHPDFELALPIAHDVGVTPWGTLGTQSQVAVMTISKQQVLQVNRRIAKQSAVVAARDRRTVEALSRVAYERD